MSTIDYIKKSLTASQSWLMPMVEDMRDAPLTRPTSDGGNHPLWILGHIICSEAAIFDGFVLGQRSRFADMHSQFGIGSSPSDNADDYPSIDDLIDRFQEIRGAVVAHLDEMTDEDLVKPSKAPEKYGAKFGTLEKCMIALTLHPAFHAGQVADSRRMAGKAPLTG